MHHVPYSGGCVRLTALRRMFPQYSFTFINHPSRPRFEAVAKDAATPLYCLVSADTCEIWRELWRSAVI